MAKQHVSFFERHVEKCAVGLGGVVLLGVAALYLVQTPNTIELVSGDKAGPARLYENIGEQAQMTAEGMKRGTLGEFEPLPDIGEELNPLQVARLDPEFAVLTGVPGFDVPKVPGVSQGPTRKIEIAGIHPPSRPVATVGRATLVLPEVEYLSAMRTKKEGSSPRREGQVQVKRDQFWVTLASLINRKQQNETFRAARYEPEQDVLVVAGIEVQRQELLGDGQWSPPVLVEPYAQQVLQDRRQVDVIEQKDGTSTVRLEGGTTEDALDLITGYRDALSGLNEQIEVLRPEFQPLLDEQKDQWRWSVPKKLTAFGQEVDMCDERWGVYCPPEEDGPGASGRDTSDRDEAMAAKKAREDLSKAEELLVQRKCLEAGEILYELRDSKVLSVKQLKDVNELLDENEECIVVAINTAAVDKEREEKKLERQFGPDYDPYWVTDISIEPGKTYRYRVRVLALNRYAGMAGYLSEPMAAGQVIVPGEWSTWSEPLAVRAATYLLATQNAGANEVSVYMYRWRRNKWNNERPKLTVGQEVALGAGDEEPCVVTDFAGNRLFPMSARGRDGSYRAEMQPTTSLTLVNAMGEVEERLQPLDAILQKELRDAIKKQAKLEQQAVGGDRRPDRTVRPGREKASPRDNRRPDRRPPRRGTPKQGRDRGGNIAS